MLVGNKSFQDEAIVFTKDWVRANNLTQVNESTNLLTSSVETKSSMLCRSVMSRIQETLNQTQLVVADFYRAYLNRTVSNSTLEEFVRVLREAIEKSWKSVVKYGFWRVTRQLSGIESFDQLDTNSAVDSILMTKRSTRGDRDRDERASSIFKVIYS